MRDGIKQEICGHLQPLRLDKNTVPGDITTLLDWAAIMNYHKPANSVYYIFKGQLEYLQCDYHISSLNKINSTNLPKVNELRDTNLQKQAKYAEFKRNYNVKTGHVVELMLHTKWESQNWGIPKASEYLYNLGQYGYLNLFDPYLVRDSEILYSDARYKVGISIDGFLGDFDVIEINGGYSGVISYFESESPGNLSEAAGSVLVGTQPAIILSPRTNRKILFVSNDGDSRLFFRFSFNSDAVSTNSPFLEPGENLSIEFDRATWSGGNEHQWVQSATKYCLPQALYGVRASKAGKVCYQEFY